MEITLYMLLNNQSFFFFFFGSVGGGISNCSGVTAGCLSPLFLMLAESVGETEVSQ